MSIRDGLQYVRQSREDVIALEKMIKKNVYPASGLVIAIAYPGDEGEIVARLELGAYCDIQGLAEKLLECQYDELVKIEPTIADWYGGPTRSLDKRGRHYRDYHNDVVVKNL